MADAALILEVRELLPEDAAWDDGKIEVYLDAGRSVAETMRIFWQSRAASLYSMIDVAESGSSRSLSRLYDNAQRQAEYWDEQIRVAKEDQERADRRIRFNTITRT